MTTLILVRHGQSVGNVEDRFVGQTDSPLTELGIFQAEKTAEFVTSDYKFDKIYSSDLSRAYDTGKKISEKSGAPIEIEKRLREIYAGDWETLSFDEIISQYEKEFALWQDDIGNSACVGGETVKEVYERSVAAFKDIAEKSEGLTVCLTSHAIVIRSIICYVKGIPVEDMKNSTTWVSNASITEIRYENGKFSVIREGYDGHLEGFKSQLPANV